MFVHFDVVPEYCGGVLAILQRNNAVKVPKKVSIHVGICKCKKSPHVQTELNIVLNIAKKMHCSNFQATIALQHMSSS